MVHTDGNGDYTAHPFFVSSCVIQYSLAPLPLLKSKYILDGLGFTMFLLPQQITGRKAMRLVKRIQL